MIRYKSQIYINFVSKTVLTENNWYFLLLVTSILLLASKKHQFKTQTNFNLLIYEKSYL